jgi:hypothetical protein
MELARQDERVGLMEYLSQGIARDEAYPRYPEAGNDEQAK